VVHLIALFETAQNRDGVLHAGRSAVYRLEPTLERGVFFDVFPVFIERGRADRPELPAREGGLQQIGSVHRPLGGAGSHERVQLIDKQNDFAVRLADFIDDRLETLLELSAEFAPRDERAEVEREELFILEAVGDIA
jgi:hypothetical protein